jgi:hypothetical protein
MAAKLEKRRTAGILKRDSRYVVVFYAAGRQRKQSARTLEQARRLKRKRETAAPEAKYASSSLCESRGGDDALGASLALLERDALEHVRPSRHASTGASSGSKCPPAEDHRSRRIDARVSACDGCVPRRGASRSALSCSGAQRCAARRS